MECRVSSHLDHEFLVDGRVYREEILWWNPGERKKSHRGILGSMLEKERRASIRSLFSINLTGVPSTTGTSKVVKISEPPPLEPEILASILHDRNAYAYYCPNDNGWAILSKQIPPPTASDFPFHCYRDQHHGSPLNDNAGQPIRRANLAHHFHIHEDTFVDFVDKSLEDSTAGLSQHVCCQCSFRVGFLSGVIPKGFIWTLEHDNLTDLSETKTQRVFGMFRAIRTLITIIENRLWKANDNYIKVMSPGLTGILGWNSNIQNIFESLGFNIWGPKDDPLLSPPSIQTNTSHGKQNRKRLLRAWVELQSWLSDFVRQNDCRLGKRKEFTLYVELKDVYDAYHAVVSVHRPKVSRIDLSRVVLGAAIKDFELSCKWLGVAKEDYSPELLGFAYIAQCRCDPAGTPRYFTSLTTIVKILRVCDICPPLLQHLVEIERCRGRFTLHDVLIAATTLGFGSGSGTPTPDDGFSAEFVENAWDECIKRSWQDEEHGKEIRRNFNEALRILAEYWNNVRLRTACERRQNIDMDPENAYNTLELPDGADDSVVTEACEIKLEEMQKQLDIMREAVACIAEIKNSRELRQFVATRMKNNLCPDFNVDGKLLLPTAESDVK